MATKAPKVSMNERTALRKRVRAAVLAEVKRDGPFAVAKRLGMSKRIVQFWVEGSWPSWPTSQRLAPMLGVK